MKTLARRLDRDELLRRSPHGDGEITLRGGAIVPFSPALLGRASIEG